MAIFSAVAMATAAQHGEEDLSPLAHEADKCDIRASALNIVEPWERFSSGHRYGGRIAVLDLGGPIETRYHLLVIAYESLDAGPALCRIVSLTEPGLSLALPIQFHSIRRGGESELDIRFSGSLRVRGQSRLADTVLRIAVDIESEAKRFDLFSAGPSWPYDDLTGGAGSD